MNTNENNFKGAYFVDNGQIFIEDEIIINQLLLDSSKLEKYIQKYQDACLVCKQEISSEKF